MEWGDSSYVPRSYSLNIFSIPSKITTTAIERGLIPFLEKLSIDFLRPSKVVSKLYLSSL
jgi:hypothetical protein